jgi:hypothetical protein
MHDDHSHATLTATLAFISGFTGFVLTEHALTGLVALVGSLAASMLAQLGRRAIHIAGDVMELRTRRRLARMGLLEDPDRPPPASPSAPPGEGPPPAA